MNESNILLAIAILSTGITIGYGFCLFVTSKTQTKESFAPTYIPGLGYVDIQAIEQDAELKSLKERWEIAKERGLLFTQTALEQLMEKRHNEINPDVKEIAKHNIEILKRKAEMFSNLSKPNSFTLTIQQIKEIAEFSGLVIKEPSAIDDMEAELTIEKNPEQPIRLEDGRVAKFPAIAYFEEYPEEGVMPLGEEIKD